MALLRLTWLLAATGLLFTLNAEALGNSSNTTLNATNSSPSNATPNASTGNATNASNAANGTNTTGAAGNVTAPSAVLAFTNASALLELQNQRRCLHASPPLQWSPGLATAAAAIALQWLTQPLPGVNVWLGAQAPTPQQVVDAWYAEIAWYQFDSSVNVTNGTNGILGNSSGASNVTVVGNGTNSAAFASNVTGNTTNDTSLNITANYSQSNFSVAGSVGNFTQLVWRATTQVGCGTSTLGGFYLVVCLYNVSGNVPGQYQQNVLPVSRGRLECGPRLACNFTVAKVQELMSTIALDYANRSSNLSTFAAAWLRNGTYFNDGLYFSSPAQGIDLIRALLLAERQLEVQQGLRDYRLQVLELQNNSGMLRAAVAANLSWNGTWFVEGPELYTLYCNDSLGQLFVQSLDDRTGTWTQVSAGNPQGSILQGSRTLDPDCRGTPGQAVPMKCCSYTTNVLASFSNRTICPPLSSLNSTYLDFSVSCVGGTFQYGRQCGAFCQCKSMQTVPANTCVLLEDSTQQNVYAMFGSCPGLFPAAQSASPQGQIRYALATSDPQCVAAPGQAVPLKCCQNAASQLAAFDGQGACFQPDPQRPLLTFGVACNGTAFTFGDLCRSNCSDCDLVHRVSRPGCVALKGVPGYSYYGQFDSCLGSCDLSTISFAQSSSSSVSSTNSTSNVTWNSTVLIPNATNVTLATNNASNTTSSNRTAVNATSNGTSWNAASNASNASATTLGNLSAACALLVQKTAVDPTSYFEKALAGQLNWSSSLVAMAFQQLPEVYSFSNGTSDVVLIRGDRNTSDVAVNSTDDVLTFIFPRPAEVTHLLLVVTPLEEGLSLGTHPATEVLQVRRFSSSGGAVTSTPFRFSIYAPSVTWLRLLRFMDDGTRPRSVAAEGGGVERWGSGGWWNITSVGTSAFVGVDVTANFSVSLWPQTRGSTARITLALRADQATWLGNELRVTLPADFTPNHCDDGYSTCLTQTEIKLLDGNDALVLHVAKVVPPVVFLQLAQNLTLSGMAQIVLTNVSLPNHCDDTTFLVEADYCQTDQWGARVCAVQQPAFSATFSAATDLDGVPQGCSICNACRSHPAGFLQCNAGSHRFLAPPTLPATTCSG